MQQDQTAEHEARNASRRHLPEHEQFASNNVHRGRSHRTPSRLRAAARDPARVAIWAIHPKRRARRQPREPTRCKDLIGAAAPLSSFLNLLSVTD